jgi:hypothetical protein
MKLESVRFNPSSVSLACLGVNLNREFTLGLTFNLSISHDEPSHRRHPLQHNTF